MSIKLHHELSSNHSKWSYQNADRKNNRKNYYNNFKENNSNRLIINKQPYFSACNEAACIKADRWSLHYYLQSSLHKTCKIYSQVFMLWNKLNSRYR